MSSKQLYFAFKQKVSPMHKLVLLVLADTADDKGVSRSTLNNLCAVSGLPLAEVSQIIVELREKGMVSIYPQMTSAENSYHLELDGSIGKV